MASSSSYQDENSAIAEINVTPLVDVVLVLLVIFMVTAPMIAAQGISVESPVANSGTAITGDLTLSLSQEGVLLVKSAEKEESFAPEERTKAEEMLREHVQNFPETKAIIAGDRSVPHGDVIEVIDLVRAAGIEKFALRTKQPMKR